VTHIQNKGETMEIVYIVFYDDNYNDRQIEQIFRDEESAEAYAKSKNESDSWWCYVEEETII
jgi:hypothetical protein